MVVVGTRRAADSEALVLAAAAGLVALAALEEVVGGLAVDSDPVVSQEASGEAEE
jgi:hypothetical protein